ncbi:unnamed protein product, partial [Brachionus calyciflorus]
LSISNGKPDLNILLEKIIKELRILEIGISFLKNTYENIKFFLIAGVFDKPARSSVLCHTSSNGFYGCIKCLQIGVRITKEKTGGTVHVYPFDSKYPDGPQRTVENYNEHLDECLTTSKKTFGIAKKSLLSNLKYFNPLLNTCIDTMHSIFLGVTKNFFKYWFSNPISNNYSLRKKIGIIDERLLKIKPPSFICSAPRSVTKWHKWRAHEFMNFILHFSLIVFSNVMEFKYYQNLKLFVISLEHLYAPSINKNDLDIIQRLLRLFVSQLSKLYDDFIMLSGVHELLHLVDCTLDFGPLNNINCFQFEEVNRKVMRLVNGKNLMGDEFVKIFNITQKMVNTLDTVPEDDIFYKFLNSTPIIKSSNYKKMKSLEGARFNKKFFFAKNEHICQLILDDFGIITENLKIFSYLKFNGILYTDQFYQSKFGNFAIYDFERLRYGLITALIEVDTRVFLYIQEIIPLYRPYFFESEDYIKSDLQICSVSNNYFVTKIESVNKILFAQVSETMIFISKFKTNHIFN